MEDRVNDVFQYERHYSVVVLLEKDGSGPAFVIQKNGQVPFDFKVDSFSDGTVRDSGTGGVVFPYNNLEYAPTVIEGKSSPIYRSPENNTGN